MAEFKDDSRFTFEINILKGEEVSYDNDYTSVGEFVLHSLENDLAFVVQVDAATDEEYTYGKMRERSVRCALWMRSQGILKMPRILVPPFEEDSACALIEKYKASWIFLTSYMIDRLVKFDAIGKYDLSSLTAVHHAGSPLHISSCEALANLLPKALILSGYGMTDGGDLISQQSTKFKPGSCGQIMANARLKVIDLDTGKILGANQKGELMLKTNSMMSFYYGNPQATTEAIDEEGWLHLGDLGYFDEDGEVFLIDRLIDMIRGECDIISLSGIESVISSHPGVKEVAIVGQPCDQDQDLPTAFVVRANDSSDTSEQVSEAEIVNLVIAELPDGMQFLTCVIGS